LTKAPNGTIDVTIPFTGVRAHCWVRNCRQAGERLRRHRANSTARVQLTAALDAFERLDARPWKKRAGLELRALGAGVTAAEDCGVDPLTPQERVIAMLAATGLTNKEIGRRLYLSHRTVGAHLYRVFPKLGISSRAALRDALGPRY
jgi:DNA-binding NarL/FixJ family response regulator